jgi:hypothetical protein
MAIGPLVPTADAARELYRTIAHIRHDPIKPSNDIRVSDEGDHWVIYQSSRDAVTWRQNANGTETVSVVAGGGGLELEIKKCDASTVGHYDR